MQRPTTTDEMLGYILEPTPQAQQTSQPSEPKRNSPRYRLQQLIRKEPGKRTFLATDEHSQSKVVVKLLLYATDSIADEAAENAPQTQAQKTETQKDSPLPYLDSFEVETPIGAALALIKPYKTAATHTPTGKEQPNRSSAKAVTTAPQNAYGGFRIRSTPNKLEIHCLQSYIREGLVVRSHPNPTAQTAILWAIAIFGTFSFVGGTVAITGSVLYGIVIATILPLIFHQLTAPSKKRQQKAVLRLTNESGGRTFVSLMTIVMTKRRHGKRLSVPTESTLHCSSLSIKRIKIEPAFLFSFGVDPLGAAIVITFHNAPPKKRLRIVGSYKEMRWLSHHLSKWGDARPTIN